MTNKIGDIAERAVTPKTKGTLSVIWSNWDQFWQNTGIGAVSNAGRANNSPLRRAIWVIVFCIFGGISAYNLIDVIDNYMKFPTSTSLTIALKTKVN